MFALLALTLAVAAPADAVAIAAPSARLFQEAEAPLGPATSFAVSSASIATGLTLMMASTLRLGFNTRGEASNIAMFSVGFLLLNSGPNMADIASGNLRYAFERGALRIVLLVVSALTVLLGPIGAVGLLTGFSAWFAWCVADVVDSRRASERWTRRMNKQPHPPVLPGLRF